MKVKATLLKNQSFHPLVPAKVMLIPCESNPDEGFNISLAIAFPEDELLTKGAKFISNKSKKELLLNRTGGCLFFRKGNIFKGDCCY